MTVDYHSPSVEEDLIAALDGREVAGALALAPGCLDACNVHDRAAFITALGTAPSSNAMQADRFGA